MPKYKAEDVFCDLGEIKGKRQRTNAKKKTPIQNMETSNSEHGKGNPVSVRQKWAGSGIRFPPIGKWKCATERKIAS